MDVIGHNHVAVNKKAVAHTSALKGSQEFVATSGVAEVMMPSVTGKSDEMWEARLMTAIEAAWHDSILVFDPSWFQHWGKPHNCQLKAIVGHGRCGPPACRGRCGPPASREVRFPINCFLWSTLRLVA
jgi:hypothetical protein